MKKSNNCRTSLDKMSEEPSGGGTTFSLVFISKFFINLHWTLDRLEVVYGILLWIFLGSLQQPRANWQRRVFISQVYCLVIWWWYFGQLQTSRWHWFLQIKTRPKSAPPSSAGSPETRYLPMLATSHSWHSRMLSVFIQRWNRGDLGLNFATKRMGGRW